jgi:hypothetical protein
MLPLPGVEKTMESRNVFDGANALDRHAEKLLTGIAVVAARGLVDGEERERLLVDDPHRMRVVLEEEPIPLLGCAQRRRPLRDAALEIGVGLEEPLMRLFTLLQAPEERPKDEEVEGPAGAGKPG